MLELSGLGKRFGGGIEAVLGVDLAVRPGEFLVVVGPSGSGKSTLLRMVAGLEEPTTGEVRIDGRRVDRLPARDRDVALVFQEAALYPHLSAFENLAFGLRARKVPRDEVDRSVRSMAAALGLADLLDRRPSGLSGGERRRVALGRALVRRPRVFLLDEPLSNLDGPLRLALRDEILSAHRRVGTATVMVTHDQTEAMAMADRLAVMARGRIVQVGTPREVYESPADRFVAGFVAPWPTAFVEARIEVEGGEERGLVGDRVIGRCPASERSRSGPVLLGLRPEHVRIDIDDGDGPTAEVAHAAWLGRETLVTLAWNGRSLGMLADADSRWQPGCGVRWRADLARCLRFDPEGGRAIVSGSSSAAGA
ncbi:MAG: ABC transporter ATP-binding protein [Isosphaeraceae bacterium]